MKKHSIALIIGFAAFFLLAFACGAMERPSAQVTDATGPLYAVSTDDTPNTFALVSIEDEKAPLCSTAIEDVPPPLAQPSALQGAASLLFPLLLLCLALTVYALVRYLKL